QGYLRLLEKSVQPSGHQKGYFEAIAKSCERLTSYINDTLDAARIEAGHFQIKPVAVAPRHLMDRVVELFGPIAAEREIRLDLRLAADAPGQIIADERLLERVFSNLFSNALKFTPRGGCITVAVARAGAGHVDFSVTDTGPGIAPDQKTRIFEKFRQAHEGHARIGFGLGLAICQKIVHLHKGSMWVESELGAGSQFVFRIPISRTLEG
ncbi:MAG: HAMP domain-containing sensor histidine kinase, partial [Elusimicrobiota bacterium]